MLSVLVFHVATLLMIIVLDVVMSFMAMTFSNKLLETFSKLPLGSYRLKQ